MASYYVVELIPDAHKNAINVVFGLVLGFNPSTMECFPVPANAAGDKNAAFTHWYGGQIYSTENVAKLQSLVDSIPVNTSWPIVGAQGSVSLADAQAAAAAMVYTVTATASFTTEQAQETLAATLGAHNLQKINWDE